MGTPVAGESDAVIANPLRASGLIDTAALEVGRAYQRAHGGLLSNALLHLGSVKEGDFLRVFAELYSTRFVKSEKLKTLKLDLALLERVGVRLAERLRMCPIRWDEARGDLHVVAAVPLATNLDAIKSTGGNAGGFRVSALTGKVPGDVQMGRSGRANGTVDISTIEICGSASVEPGGSA